MRFEIKCNNPKLLKKNFVNLPTIYYEDVMKELSIEDQFDNAVMFIQDNFNKIFSLPCSEEYFDIIICKGKFNLKCDCSYEYCYRCGGDLEIYSDGELYENSN